MRLTALVMGIILSLVGPAAAGYCKTTIIGDCDKAGPEVSRRQIAECKKNKNFLIGIQMNSPDAQACLKYADDSCAAGHTGIIGLTRFEVTFDGVALPYSCLGQKNQPPRDASPVTPAAGSPAAPACPPAPTVDPSLEGTCLRDADCTEGAHPRCVELATFVGPGKPRLGPARRGCVSDLCLTDTECGANRICFCGGGRAANACGNGTCRTDADCPGGIVRGGVFPTAAGPAPALDPTAAGAALLPIATRYLP